jgi:hypothetical protein
MTVTANNYARIALLYAKKLIANTTKKRKGQAA